MVFYKIKPPREGGWVHAFFRESSFVPPSHPAFLYERVHPSLRKAAIFPLFFSQFLQLALFFRPKRRAMDFPLALGEKDVSAYQSTD